MTWNYRICKDKDGYTIREVYYNNGTDEIGSWTADPVEPFGETKEELIENLAMMMAAVIHPVIDLDKQEKK
jgi:hypothetical protein